MSEKKFEIIGADETALYAGEHTNFKNVLHIEGEDDGPGQVVITQVERSGWTGDAYHGRTFEIDLPGCVKVEKLVELIESWRDEIQEALNDYTEKMNEHGNYIGAFDDSLTRPIREAVQGDGSYQYEWVFNDADDYISRAWSGSLSDDYEFPADGDFKKLAQRIMADADTSESYLAFDAEELAECLAGNQEIWETE